MNATAHAAVSAGDAPAVSLSSQNMSAGVVPSLACSATK